MEDYNDPVLREVFQSSKNIRTNSQYYGQPEPLPQGVPAKQTSVPRNQGRVPGTPSGVQTSRYQLNGYQPAPTAYTNNVNNGNLLKVLYKKIFTFKGTNHTSLLHHLRLLTPTRITMASLPLNNWPCKELKDSSMELKL